MTQETLEKAQELQGEITHWNSKLSAINSDADRISISFEEGSLHSSMKLGKAEIQIVKNALREYYKLRIEELKEEFERL